MSLLICGISLAGAGRRNSRDLPALQARRRDSCRRDQEQPPGIHHQIGKVVRKRYTQALKEHGVEKPVHYAVCTNETYKALFDVTAKQLAAKRGLAPKANIRDSMSLPDLAYTMASEALASERIEQQRSTGFIQCAGETKQASTSIPPCHRADRKSRVIKGS